MTDAFVWMVPSTLVIALLFCGLLFYQSRRMTGASLGATALDEFVDAYQKKLFLTSLPTILLISSMIIALAVGGVVQFTSLILFLVGIGVTFLITSFSVAQSGQVARAITTLPDLNTKFRLMFRRGAVIVLITTTLVLFLIWAVFKYTSAQNTQDIQTGFVGYVTPFVLGLCVQSFIGRVVGGHFSKFADVVSDSVTLARPETRSGNGDNPAELVDAVGDGVGDLAGSVAEYVDQLAVITLVSMAIGTALPNLSSMPLAAPFLIFSLLCLGILLSMGALFLVKTARWSTQKNLIEGFHKGFFFQCGVTAVLSLGLFFLLDIKALWYLWGAFVIGILVKLVLQLLSELTTSDSYKPIRVLAETACTTTASGLIVAIGEGFKSILWPGLLMLFGFYASYLLGAQFFMENYLMGLFGVVLMLIGMFSASLLTVTARIAGSFADSSLFFSESSFGDAPVQENALDSFGNTFAASLRTYLVVSATIVSFLFIAFFTFSKGAYGPFNQPIILDVLFLVGLLFGVVILLFVIGNTLYALGKASAPIIEEIVYRVGTGEQFSSKEVQTKILRKIELSGAVLILLFTAAPVLIGFFFGMTGVFGFLVGVLGMGFLLSVALSNTGVLMDNAKKYNETGQLGGVGTKVHENLVAYDNFGDILKDAVAPMLTSYVKLAAVLGVFTSSFYVIYSIF